MRIDTPEQIGLDLELAGLGSRFVAQVVDWVWKCLLAFFAGGLGLIILALFNAKPVDQPSKFLVAVVVAVIYLLMLGYGVYFEARWNGQTPGKRFARIRVVRQGGAPVDGVAAGVRNLLAVADFLPAGLLLGAVLILLTPNRQRLGDLAAGTIVVRERSVGPGPEEEDELIEFASAEVVFTPTQLDGLVPADRAVIRSFLQRYREMDRAGGDRLGVKMAAVFRRKTGYTAHRPPADGDEARVFLASLLRDYEQYRRHS
jgi:uncharacterized RDD family membrane protein YckC